ncbi:hypothetical protein [Intrasporangium mesophilum]
MLTALSIPAAFGGRVVDGAWSAGKQAIEALTGREREVHVDLPEGLRGDGGEGDLLVPLASWPALDAPDGEAYAEQMADVYAAVKAALEANGQDIESAPENLKNKMAQHVLETSDHWMLKYALSSEEGHKTIPDTWMEGLIAIAKSPPPPAVAGANEESEPPLGHAGD